MKRLNDQSLPSHRSCSHHTRLCIHFLVSCMNASSRFTHREQNKTKLDPTLPHSSMRPSSSLGVFHERNDLLPLCALQGQSHLESGECLECYPPVMEVRSCKVHSQLFEYVPGRSKAPISSLSHTCEGGLQAPLDSRGSKGEKPPLLSVKS